MGVSIFQNLKDGAGSILDTLGTYITEGFNSAIEFITSLPSKAYEWGTDFVDGIVNGIKDAMGKVEDAVSALAAKIRSYLHFSVPDEGPLTEYESWMPDFMEGLAKGIEENKNKVVQSIKGLSTDISVKMSAINNSENRVNTNDDTRASSSGGVILKIENFNNNCNQDVKQLSQELAFITKKNPVK